MRDAEKVRAVHTMRPRDSELIESMVESITIPLVVLDHECRVKITNPAFYREYRFQQAEVEDQLFWEVGAGQWDLPELRSAVEELGKESEGSFRIEIKTEFVGQGGRIVCIDLQPVGPFQSRLILLTIKDITRWKEAEQRLLLEQQQLRANLTACALALQEANQKLHSQRLGQEQVEVALHVSEHALRQSREELRHLSASLMNAQDAERRRVSRELHDDLSQRVAKLQFDIEILEQKLPFADIQRARGRMQDLVQQAAGLSRDLRRVAHQLHPATLDHLGLSIALRSYTEEFSRSTAIPVKFSALSVPRNLPIELASGLYRIVQEALRNVGKHASHAEVEIVLALVPEGLALFIRDNGEGFDMETARGQGGLGLISMEERVRLLEGTFSVETQPGKGVLLFIQCPLPKESS